jgi:hypothetical protein
LCTKDRCGGKGRIMSSRVLSTEEAQQAIAALESLITGGFMDQISQMNTQGQTLSEPNVWDGPLAEQFRGDTWPAVHASLIKAQQELEDLRGQLQQISQNIFSAGGQN